MRGSKERKNPEREKKPDENREGMHHEVESKRAEMEKGRNITRTRIKGIHEESRKISAVESRVLEAEAEAVGFSSRFQIGGWDIY